MLRNIFLTACSFVFLLAIAQTAGCSSNEEAMTVSAQSQSAQQDHMVVYYFHTNFRCVNCYNMEKWTKELVETSFKDQVDSGRLVFKIINTDEKGNKHFMTDYQLFTKSIVLALVKGGNQQKYDNLTKVWEYLTNKDKFQAYVRSEIEKYLKEI